jgi:hypothetical protein
VKNRYAGGRRYAIVVCAEGAIAVGDLQVITDRELGGQIRKRKFGMAELLDNKIAEMTKFETRSLVLGHLQRGGSPPTATACWPCASAPLPSAWSSKSKFGHLVAYHPSPSPSRKPSLSRRRSPSTPTQSRPPAIWISVSATRSRSDHPPADLIGSRKRRD